MSAFKDLVEQDIHNVFLDIRFFGELRTVEYESGKAPPERTTMCRGFIGSLKCCTAPFRT